MKEDEILEYRDNLAHVENEFQNFGFVWVNSIVPFEGLGIIISVFIVYVEEI